MTSQPPGNADQRAASAESHQVLRKIESDANDALIALEKMIVDAVLHDLTCLYAPLRDAHFAVQEVYNVADERTVRRG